MWRVLASVAGAVLLLWPKSLLASPPPVHLDVAACESLDSAGIRRIFAADLGTAATSEVGPEVTEVEIRCEGDRVVVRVKDPLSRKTLRRSFDPKSFGNQGQSRLIAIAASELVLASWAELAANPTPKVLGEGEAAKPETLATARGVVAARTPKSPPPAPAKEPEYDSPTEAPPERPPPRESGNQRYPTSVPPLERIMAVVSTRSLIRVKGDMAGGGARFGQERYGVVSWAADALVENGSLRGESVTSTSLGGYVAFYAHTKVIAARLGGGLRAGVLSVAGSTSVAAWGWPMVVTSVTLRLGPVVVEVAGEGGLVDLIVSRNQVVKGEWVSGQVGLGLAL